MSSQAKDDGNENIWYEVQTSQGNYWEDWGGTGIYEIDGLGGNDDLYPLNTIPVISELLEGNTVVLVLLLFSSASVLFVFSQKKKK
ncbi:MAG: hypothetical protein H7641_15320 [Candidatus Heimdallarchaeota archaeon]|nr:hypothetical protein [Candidatus Heimdallarchaeota archaeon]